MRPHGQFPKGKKNKRVAFIFEGILHKVRWQHSSYCFKMVWQRDVCKYLCILTTEVIKPPTSKSCWNKNSVTCFIACCAHTCKHHVSLWKTDHHLSQLKCFVFKLIDWLIEWMKLKNWMKWDLWIDLTANSAGQMSHVKFSFVTFDHMTFSPLWPALVVLNASSTSPSCIATFNHSSKKSWSYTKKQNKSQTV